MSVYTVMAVGRAKPHLELKSLAIRIITFFNF